MRELVFPPFFLKELFGIFGEPERVELSFFKEEFYFDDATKLLFPPQYVKLTHYRDLKRPVLVEGIIQIYSEQLLLETPRKKVERVVWSNFFRDNSFLFSAEFTPTRFLLEVEKNNKKILSEVEKLINQLKKPRPLCEIKFV